MELNISAEFILAIWDMGAFLEAYFTKKEQKRAFCLLTPSSKIPFSIISNENIFKNSGVQNGRDSPTPKRSRIATV